MRSYPLDAASVTTEGITRLRSEEAEMTTDNRHKWECVSPGEYDTTYRCSKCGALHTDQADDLSSVIPEFGCIVNTDLKSMTVEERDALVYGPCEEDWKKTFPGGSRADAWCLFVEAWLLGYERQARRLEEAQQKIVAQQARLRKFKMDVFEYLVVRGEGTEEYANLMAHSSLIQNDEAEANEALAAHDADVAAKAIEDFIFQFGDEDVPPRLVDDALAKAAEYRAKAGRKE